jgi:putative transposase
MQRGFLYLRAIMDWHSRKVLSWRLSNTMDAGLCISALKEALATYCPPAIFNSDQGSQFTSADFSDVLKDAGVKISMDVRSSWIDNRMIERPWRSLKYECAFWNAFETGLEARQGIGAWIAHYNEEGPHSSHGLVTLDEVDDHLKPNMKLAA